MERWWAGALLPVLLLASAGAAGAETAKLSVSLPGLGAEARLPDRLTFCRPDGRGRATTGGNRSPAVRWSAGPFGTRSYAIVMTDRDVPADAARVNRAGLSIPTAASRTTFYHWMLVDLAPTIRSLPEGADSSGVTPRGKPLRRSGSGRRGINDYTGFLKSDPAMRGTYAGYDGPCPPWNDARVHRYTISVLALDTPRLDLPAGFDGRALTRALAGHVLARGAVTKTYTTRDPRAGSAQFHGERNARTR